MGSIMDSTPPAQLMRSLGLLWLAGVAMRITVLAVPPVIPLIHADFHMTEAEVGFLVGLPLLVFALAAVPGSLLVARLGTVLTVTIGMAVTALAAAGRGAVADLWQLYAATIVMGFGIAIVQPAMPTLVREWLPSRMALGTAASTNGMLAAVMLAATLTIPVVLPMAGGSWRLALVVWAAPVLVIALVFLWLHPRSDHRAPQNTATARLWWPDWKNPLTWLLGLTFGCNNAGYFGANAFLPDFLASQGRADLIGAALGWLNAGQFIASLAMLAVAERLQRRAWPYVVCGLTAFAGFVGMVLASGNWIVVSAAVMGFANAITLAVILALPPLLSRPGDAHRTAAGMFTISYACALIVPTISGGLWDLTGKPWTAFVPLGLCALGLAVLGTALSRYRGPAGGG
jgi:CP family cyanate transporter-like MFS transporter